MTREKELLWPVEDFLRKQDYAVYHEVPLLSKRIDLIGVRSGFNDITAIELKVSKWKKALEQAITDRLCANRVYVALSSNYVHRVQKELFREWGIGILEVDGKAIVHQEAKVNLSPQISLRNSIKSYILRNYNLGLSVYLDSVK